MYVIPSRVKKFFWSINSKILKRKETIVIFGSSKKKKGNRREKKERNKEKI